MYTTHSNTFQDRFVSSDRFRQIDMFALFDYHSLASDAIRLGCLPSVTTLWQHSGSVLQPAHLASKTALDGGPSPSIQSGGLQLVKLVFDHTNALSRVWRAIVQVRTLALLGTLALALGLRLAFVSRLPVGGVFASVDAKGYHILAQNLLDHGVLSLRADPPHIPDPIRTPLYPAFIALILLLNPHAERAIPLAQVVLDTITTAVVYGIASRWTDRRRGLLAATLYALNPISFLFVGEAMTEILLAFLLACTFYGLTLSMTTHKGSMPVLAGVGLLASLCILCKPNMVLLPLILTLGMIADARSLQLPTWRRAGVLLGAVLLAVSPWVIRNRLVFGDWFLSLAFEDNLSRVSAVAALLEARGEVVAPWTPRWEEVYIVEVVLPASDQHGWTKSDAALNPHENAQRLHDLSSVATNIIRQHPIDALISHMKGVFRQFVPSLHRYAFAYLSARPWPQAESLSSVLLQSGAHAMHGNAKEALVTLSSWWERHPPLAQKLWVASVVIQCLGYGLLLAGLWSLRARHGLFLGVILTLLYLVLLPGPIAYVRFWMPGIPVAAVVVGCSFWRTRMD
jgi:4-amino-4-deoxy-L-arabinose transferase-like glycosyltransferase